MSILCSNAVCSRLELLIHKIRKGEPGKHDAFEMLIEIIEDAEDGDMLSIAIRSVFSI